MKDADRTLNHAMMSFALMGGLLVTPKPHAPHVQSRPQDYKPLSGK